MQEHRTRRDFIKQSALAGAVLASGGVSISGTETVKIKLGVFSKHLQWLNYSDTSDAVAEIGWDGIECPVRPGGHVLPERVEEDLPKMLEALRKNNLDILMATTKFLDVDEPHIKTVLKTLAKLNIKTYRISGWKYKENMSVPDRLTEVREQLEKIVDINRELGLFAAFQNHSGTGIGAPMWDIYEMIKDLDTGYIGSAFDIGHATVEGGYAWPIHAKLMLPFTKIVIVKDFKWGQDNQGKWQVLWCPLGQGMVNTDFIKMLKETDYKGPIIQHFEYDVEGKTEQDKQKNLIKAMKKDCKTLKTMLSDAGLR
ncbi:TIM barrel protein [candidate division KSB1 bacterium]|nr:TIM barrel protein [candidate division KSB1 bacterium]